MLSVFINIWPAMVGLFTWLFSRPQTENPTMNVIRHCHAREDARRETGEAMKVNKKRLEDLVRKKAVRKSEIRVLESEQMERLRAQEFHNEQKKLLDQQQVIANRQRELGEAMSEQETAAATGFRYPTAHEFNTALERVQYNKDNFHFAIAGTAGCGKSSLINSFLNLDPKDVGAAPTGVTETTLEIGRYPDSGTQPPRPWTVWYDIPGAGTQGVSDSQYFTTQALFVFDIIIVTIGNRLMETDCQIIRSCLQFQIPFFIVRSKSDQEIMNMMRDEDEDYPGPFDSGELYLRCRKTFREQSQQMVIDEMRRANLPNQRLYCVSKRTLRDVYIRFLAQSINPDDDCHELALVNELMTAVYQRRGGSDKDTDAPGASIPQNSTLKADVAQTIANEGSDNVHQKPEAELVQIPPVLRLLYLPIASTTLALKTELDKQNPGLSSLFVAAPRMLDPDVALLSFDPEATIPARISAYRRTQRPRPYFASGDEYPARRGKSSN